MSSKMRRLAAERDEAILNLAVVDMKRGTNVVRVHEKTQNLARASLMRLFDAISGIEATADTMVAEDWGKIMTIIEHVAGEVAKHCPRRGIR